MIGFEAYQPGLWFDESLVMLKARVRQTRHKEQSKRALPWKLNFPSSVLKMGLAAATSVILFEAGSASNMEALGAQITAEIEVLQRRVDPALSPLTDINRSFNDLFDKFRGGAKLIPSEQVRKLAVKAVSGRGEKVDAESWARSIADQTKDAND
jgi:hypothetical protein